MINLEDIEEIKQLKARYCRAVDLKLWPTLRGVFADDCEFAGTATVATDPDRFVAGVERLLSGVTTAHHLHNPEIRGIDAGRAAGVWAFQDYLSWEPETEVAGFLRGSERQTSVLGFGYYEEEYAKGAGGWRIARIVLTRQKMIPLFEEMPIFGRGEELDQVWGRPTGEWMKDGGYRAPA